MPATVPAPSHRLWTRRLARYRRLVTTAEAAAETGWFREANDRYERETVEIAARFGGGSEDGRRLRRAAFERMSAAEDAYWDRCTAPMQTAAVALALTPAPDLPALAAKIAAMRDEKLPELGRMKRDCFDVLEEDVRRLAGLQ